MPIPSPEQVKAVDPQEHAEETMKQREAEAAKKQITQEVAQGEIFKHARESVRRAEYFQGERMDPDQFKSLQATIEDALQNRTKSLVDIWVLNHPNEVRERSYNTGQLSDRDKLKMVREIEGDTFFENDDQYRRFAHVRESLDLSNGQPDLHAGLVSFIVFDDLQRNLEKKYASNLADPAFLAERKRNVDIQDALHKSIYNKGITFAEAKVQQDAFNDIRTSQDLDEFLKGIDANAALQTRRDDYRGLLQPTEITALESLGYEIKPLKVKFLGLWPKGFGGIKIFKDGKEVQVNNADIQRQFVEAKQKELAQKYLGEYNDKEKLTSLKKLLINDPNELSRLSEDLERKTTSKLIEKTEMIRLKKENPEEAKHYQEVLKDKGESVTQMIGNTLEGGEQSDYFKNFKGESDDELKDFFKSYHQPESYFDKLTDTNKKTLRETLAKARKHGILRWVFAVFDAMNQLEKLATS